ncbi:hypothetical protein SAMN04487906_1292 [Zhouia amylolytica]|uniref:DUF4398 domain-containing protein n=1 Tax=Zhouia amylolytica TaxID=376730 RepID=A0A1I6RSR1_9FLAO|nr:hypothetical protein [Zhouia amylolytica]SFS67724.1 hypothetical protein SAMN04487906_1292 [Zhouia amylolytica]
MKKAILLTLSCFMLSSFVLADCTDAHSYASYALMHTKRALKADNFDHQRYYADRAIEAFEKTQSKMQGCDCEKAKKAIEEALIDLKKAADPVDWKTGNFYTQKALEDADAMMNALELCTSSSYTPPANTDTYSNDVAIAETSSSSNEDNLLAAQKALEAKQQQLLKEQQKLQEQIAKQEAQKAKLLKEREAELTEQRLLKNEADQAIANYKSAMQKLLNTMECPKAQQVLDAFIYNKSESSLQNETLEDTRRYYQNLLIKVQQEALSAMQSCN